MRSKPLPKSTASDSELVAKAAIRAAEHLAISNRLLARIIGLSEPTVSRMKRGEYALAEGQKAFELAILFIRLYRSLDAVVGGDNAVAREWLRNENTALKGPPIDLIETVAGLGNVIQYLDARRAVI
jgi:hypothetical protein